jgi:hypothetical protein
MRNLTQLYVVSTGFLPLLLDGYLLVLILT